MPSNALSLLIPTRRALAPSLGRSPRNLGALAFSTMAAKLDPVQTAEAELAAALEGSRGLASLLDIARRFPCEPLADADVEARADAGDGLARLLVNARAWAAQQAEPGARP